MATFQEQIDRTSPRARLTFEAAIGQALDLGVAELRPSLVLASVLEDEGCAASLWVDAHRQDRLEIASALVAAEPRPDAPQLRRLRFADSLRAWVRDASLHLDARTIETTHLLVTWCARPGRYAAVRPDGLENMTPEKLTRG